MLVLKRIAGRAAAAAHLLGELDHLVDRLLARETVHELRHHGRQFGGRLPRAQLLEDRHHHGDHDIDPAAADEGQRSVEVEERGAGEDRKSVV